MLSKQSIEILIDLLEIKLSSIIVQDKDDIRELRKLKTCRAELMAFRRESSKRSKFNKIDSLSSQVL